MSLRRWQILLVCPSKLLFLLSKDACIILSSVCSPMSQDQVGPNQVAGRPEIPLPSPGYVQPLATPEPHFIYEWVTQTICFIDHSFDMAKRLCHSMTPGAMQCRATQDGWVKSSEKLRPAGGGNGNPSGTLTWRTSQTVRKGRKIWHQKTSSHRSEVVRYATGKERRAITNSSRKNEVTGPKQEWCSALDVSGGESKVWCCNEWYCRGTWNVRSMNQGELDIVKQEMARLKTNVGKIEGKRRKGWQSTKCLDGITDPMDMNLSQTPEMVEDRRAWCATVREGAESQTRLSDWKITQTMGIRGGRWKWPCRALETHRSLTQGAF